MSRLIAAFDRAYWGDHDLSVGYDLELKPAGTMPLPRIELTRCEADRPEYHFVRAADDTGAFTPGYAIMGEPVNDQLWDSFVLSMPDEHPVESWMVAAIERAGFRFDPETNAEKWRGDAEPTTHPDQRTLTP